MHGEFMEGNALVDAAVAIAIARISGVGRKGGPCLP